MIRFVITAAAFTLAAGVAHADPHGSSAVITNTANIGNVTNSVSLTQLGQVNMALIAQGRNNVEIEAPLFSSYMKIDDSFNVLVAPGAVNAMSILGTGPVTAGLSRPVDINVEIERSIIVTDNTLSLGIP